jgi:hypothetical protein
MADRALYMAKNSGRNQAIGFLSTGDLPELGNAADIVEALPKRIVRTAGPEKPEPTPALKLRPSELSPQK